MNTISLFCKWKTSFRPNTVHTMIYDINGIMRTNNILSYVDDDTKGSNK